ncbi:MAG: hypothetical protein Q4B80_03805 [Aerococcaceae bacterium]|nr:hypothetical protein [Aerococcaceae bacterium]
MKYWQKIMSTVFGILCLSQPVAAQEAHDVFEKDYAPQYEVFVDSAVANRLIYEIEQQLGWDITAEDLTLSGGKIAIDAQKFDPEIKSLQIDTEEDHVKIDFAFSKRRRDKIDYGHYISHLMKALNHQVTEEQISDFIVQVETAKGAFVEYSEIENMHISDEGFPSNQVEANVLMTRFLSEEEASYGAELLASELDEHQARVQLSRKGVFFVEKPDMSDFDVNDYPERTKKFRSWNPGERVKVEGMVTEDWGSWIRNGREEYVFIITANSGEQYFLFYTEVANSHPALYDEVVAYCIISSTRLDMPQLFVEVGEYTN